MTHTKSHSLTFPVPLSFNLIEKGTIVFDLDETLTHCTLNNIHLFDHQITIVSEKGKEATIGVNVRPHAISCLTELANDFELIIFTASHKNYADCVIDILDPEHQLFTYRLFRDSCIQTEKGFYIKDLRILNRDLSKLILVDNSIPSFAFQLDNGVPIVPFYDNKDDFVLPKLKDYLLSLRVVEDFREENVNKFGLKYLYDLNVQNWLKDYILYARELIPAKLDDFTLTGKRTASPPPEPLILKKTKGE